VAPTGPVAHDPAYARARINLDEMHRRLPPHPRHYRMLRRRSAHNPICRPSSWCIADRNLRPGEPPEGQLHRGEGHERIGSPSLSTEAWIFAARHLLAGAGAHLIVFAARFSADLTDWLSRTAAAGLASRPTARATPCAVRTGRLRNAITLELAKDVVDRRSQRKAVAGQIAPLAASAQQTEDGVHSRLQSVLRGRRPGDASGIRGSSCATPLPQIARVSAALPPIYPRVFLRPPPCSPSP